MDPKALNVALDLTERIEVPKVALQVVFDALVQSMDFGSGFLDDEDVEGLRAVAVALGVDPMTATPGDFAHKYPHPFSELGDTGRCRNCNRAEDLQCHRVRL